MSFRRSSIRKDIRSTLQGLRSRVLAGGDPLFCVVGPKIDRQIFPAFEDADNRAADLASFFPGESFFAQERRSLDGVQVLCRSREWCFDQISGVVYGL